jgi:flagellar biosynthetic protein FliO
MKLGAVLALAYVSMAALKRYTSGSVSQRGTLLEVLDSTTLGPNRSVYVVRAGAKRLVLGVTQNQITPLAELDPEDAPEAPASTTER